MMDRSKIGISACSNGHPAEWKGQVDELLRALEEMGLETVMVPHLYRTADCYSGTDAERADDLMELYADGGISDIFDISGGDLANGVLKYLDYPAISASDKTFWGYSDLTTVINAIYALTGKQSVLYQIKNVIWDETETQKKRVLDYFQGTNQDLFDISYSFLQGSHMEGTVIGGNIRCFLKLAGTKYWPDTEGKILLLESCGGGSGQIAALLTQLEDIGVFRKAAGVLLGTFTDYEKAGLQRSVFELLKMHIPDQLPVARTREIGHGKDSKAVRIGSVYRF